MAVPQDSGSVMLPEWAPQERFWMAWPPSHCLQGEGVDAELVRDAFAEIARALAELGQVTVLVNPAEAAEVSLTLGHGIGTLIASHVNCAVRQIGPGFLACSDGTMAVQLGCKGGEPATSAIIEHLGLPQIAAPLNFTGGVVDVDGQGLCLASTALLSHGVPREQVEHWLRDHAGIEKIFWLDPSFEGDSSGSLLNVARFVAPGVVLVATTDRADDPSRLALETNRQRLDQATDAKGVPLTIVELPLPRPVRRKDGRRVPMSYTNCLISGSLILLPAYQSGKDQSSYDKVMLAVPNQKLALLPAADLAWAGLGLGEMVLSQPQPRPAPAAAPAPVT